MGGTGITKLIKLLTCSLKGEVLVKLVPAGNLNQLMKFQKEWESIMYLNMVSRKLLAITQLVTV